MLYCSSAYLRDRERWTPLVFQDVKADLALAVDVAVVYSRPEDHLVPDQQ
jgi:hypothetical protein